MNALSPQSVITVSNLTKFYGDFNALGSVSFAVEKEWVYGYLGPNGAGKTTTTRASVVHVDLKTFFLTGARCALQLNNKEFKIPLLAYYEGMGDIPWSLPLKLQISQRNTSL